MTGMTSPDTTLPAAPPSPEPEVAEHAYLVVDCGFVQTTAYLFDTVNGRFQLLARGQAPTTHTPPWSDVSAGIQHAIQQVTHRTGRRLLTPKGDLIRTSRGDGSGIDFFTASFSSAPPLRTILIGLFEEMSMSTARRVLAANFAVEIDRISLADNRSQSAQLSALVAAQPDLIFIVGGTDGGAEQQLVAMLETVALAISLMPPERPPQVVFAGNKALRERVIRIFGNAISVQMTENVRPTPDTENRTAAMQQIADLYRAQQIERLPGIREVREWSPQPFMPTPHAFGAIIEFLAALQQQRVIGIDVGGHSATMINATPDHIDLAVHTDLGMGNTSGDLVTAVAAEDIAYWTPHAISAQEIANHLQNKVLHPQTIPMTRKELLFEHAVASALLQRLLAKSAESWGWTDTALPLDTRLIVLRGQTLTNVPRLGLTALTILDALQPTGIFALALDRYGALPALGALAAESQLLVVQALENGLLMHLCWVVALVGQARPGQKAVQVTIEAAGAEAQPFEIKAGEIEQLPLLPGQKAKVTIQPSRRFDAGNGLGKPITITIPGGELGILIDARGRPLPTEKNAAQQIERLGQWLKGVGAT